MSSWNTKVLHTRGEGVVLVSKKVFVLLCKVAATESSFIKPTRLGSQKMVTNPLQQGHIGRSPVDMFELAAARMRALHSFANETGAAVNVRRKGRQVRCILKIDQSFFSRVKLGGSRNLNAPCRRLFEVLGLVHGSHAFSGCWG